MGVARLKGEQTIRPNAKEITAELMPLLGGKQNIVGVAHCSTRLRVTLRDHRRADVTAVEKMDSVQTVFWRAGQMQIVFGAGLVNRIYRAVMDVTATGGIMNPAGQPELTAQKLHPLLRLITVFSNIFVPIIPVIVANGLLNGLVGVLRAFQWISPDASWLTLLEHLSGSVFLLFPVFVGFSAAKEFGSNPFLGAAIGGILIQTDLMNREFTGFVPDHFQLFGVHVALSGYQGMVIPALLSVYVMSRVESILRKTFMASLHLFIIPLVSFIFTGIFAVLVLGPLGTLISILISSGLIYVYTHVGFAAGFLFGGVYSLIVITGFHHGFHALEAGLLADPKAGINFLLPIWSIANMAQGGAGLAVWFKTKNKKTRKIAIPAVVSSFFGITEPVIFGINLKLFRPFIGGAVGGALGGMYVVLTKVGASSLGLTGIPMTTIVLPLGISNLLHYLIGIVVAVGSSFAVTWLLGFKEATETKEA